MTISKKGDDFAARVIMAMAVDMADAVETVARLQLQFAVLAKEHGVSLCVTAERV
jgi:hypothetical protein